MPTDHSDYTALLPPPPSSLHTTTTATTSAFISSSSSNSSSSSHRQQHSHHVLLTDLDHDDALDDDFHPHPLLPSSGNAASLSHIQNRRHSFHSRPLSIGHFVHISPNLAPKYPDTAASLIKTSQQTAVLAPAPSFWTGYTKSPTTSQKISSMAAAIIAHEGSENANTPNAVRTPAPGSPPELSYSKSSKSDSSSYRSSISDDGVETEKLAHFEDITLEGRESPETTEETVSANGDSNLKPESRPTLKRPPPPRLHTTMDQMRDDFAIREAPNGGRRPYPIRSFSNGGAREHNLGLPSKGKGPRRDFSNPSSPSFPLNAPQRSSSRSPSPQSRYVQSPGSIGSATPRASSERQSSDPNALSRRSSWAPSRKTVKELEAECDDMDDEVPEEAVLENVPVSPMPGMSTTQTPRASQSRSHSRSPHNRPSFPPNPPQQPLHNNLHSANVPKHAKRPHAPKNRSNTNYGGPRSPNGRATPGMMPHSVTTGRFHTGPRGPPQRSNSWAQDLSYEARELSAALEEYHERRSSEKRESRANSVPNSPPSKKRSSTSLMEMPPKQKGNAMIDPLPVSKEKEAVLTRTRPSWLPPKDQKEEKRHMREWEKMMAKAAAAEKKRESKEQEELENRTEMQDSSARIWDQHVLPNWDAVVNEPRTRELWWRGVTPRSRGLVWQKAVGNELSLTPTSYEAALKRANDLESRVQALHPEERATSKEAAWFSAIARDVPTTSPPSDTPAPDFHTTLANVLKAYAVYRNDVGYVYGTHLIAAQLCTHLPTPSESFQTLANLLNRPLPLAFFVHDTTAMARAHNLVLSTLEYKFPRLHSHLTSPDLALQPAEFLDPLFRCLFAHNLPPETVARLWDIMVFEGDRVLVRAAVAVLGCLEGRLYGGKEEVLSLLGWGARGYWTVGGEEAFVGAVREAGKVSSGGLQKAF